jgi:small neutral amino acid transporter SnatA (MarC family)
MLFETIASAHIFVFLILNVFITGLGQIMQVLGSRVPALHECGDATIVTICSVKT